MGFVENIITARIKRKQKERQDILDVEEAKSALLADPEKMATQVAGYTKRFFPFTRKPKESKFPLKHLAYDASASGTPMEGFGEELYENYKAALSKPEYRGVTSGAILRLLSDPSVAQVSEQVGLPNLMSMPRGEEGESRLAGLYRHKLKSDTSIGNLFGLLRDDETVRKPPGYEKFLEHVRSQPIEEQHTPVPLAAGVGAGFAVAGHIGKRVLARRATGAALSLLPIPGARVAAAATLAIPDFKIFDWVSNAISRSDYGRAREGTWEKLAAEFIAGGVVPAVATHRLYKAGRKALARRRLPPLVPTNRIEFGGFPPLLEYAPGAAPSGPTIRMGGGAERKLSTLADAGISRGEAFAKLARAPSGENIVAFARASAKEATARRAFDRSVGTKTAKQTILREAGVERPIRTAFTGLSEDGAEMALHFQKEEGIRKGIAKAVEYEDLINIAGAEEKAKLDAIKKAMKRVTPEVDVAFGTAETTPKTKRKRLTKADKELLAKRKAAREAAKPEVTTTTPPVTKKKRLTQADKDLLAARKAAREKKPKTVKEKLKDTADDFEELKRQAESGELDLETLVKKKPGKKKLTKAESRKAAKKIRDKISKKKVDHSEISDEVAASTAKAIKSPTVESEAERQLKAFQRETFGVVDDPLEKAADEWLKGRRTPVDKMFMGIAAVATGIIGLLSGAEEAEAGIVDAAFKPGIKFIGEKITGAETKAAMRTLVDDARALGLEGQPVDPLKPFVLPKAMGFVNTAELAVKEFGKLGAVIQRTKSVPGGIGRFLSPNSIGEVFFKTGYSPVLSVGNLMSAFGFNTQNAMTVASNIIKEVPAVSRQNANKAIVDAMRGLAKTHSADVIAYSAVEGRLNLTRKNLGKFQAKLGKARKTKAKGNYTKSIAQLEAEIPKLEAASAKLKPGYEAYSAEWEATVRDLASKYSATRLSLAAEDTAQYEFYPWLKKMMTPEEELAVARIKDFHNNFGARIEEAGVDTIKHRPYVQHSFHPDWTVEEAGKRLASLDITAADILPYSRFYRRAQFSKQMVPDIVHNMQTYIPDAERRILWSKFWDRKNPNGWDRLSNSITVRGSTELKEFFQRLRDATIPNAPTTGNRLANTYSALEVARLLAFAPSPAFKHLFKLIGTASTLGVKEAGVHAIDSGLLASRTHINSTPVQDLFRKFGVKGLTKKKQFYDDLASGLLHQGRLLNNIADLELEYLVQPGFLGAFDKALRGFNKAGSIPIRAVEHFDRGMSFLTSMEMSAKQGLTAQQAILGTYSTILKNNFLSGPLNPSWMLNPKVRALFLFQNTAFKIAERRFITALRTGRAVKGAFGTIKGKSDIGRALKELGEIARYVKTGEIDFKKNLIAGALGSERDYFGNSIVRQFMREVLLAGAIVSGGAHVGLDFMPHTFHIPFLVHGRTDPTLAVAPAAKSMIRLYDDWVVQTKEDRDFLPVAFLKSWLGSTKGIPQTANKLLRINNNDIPEIYRGSPWQYLFAVPTYGEHY